MKIRLSIDLTDLQLSALAAMFPQEQRRVGRARVTRKAAVRLLPQIVAGVLQMRAPDWRSLYVPKLTTRQREEMRDAIGYLRAMGRTDAQIAAWLVMQRARSEFPSHDIA